MKQHGYMELLGIEIKNMQDDQIHGSLVVDHQHLNYYGFVHGGVYFSLADSVAGAVSRSNGEDYVTLNSSFQYYKASKHGKLVALGTIISRGNRICVVNVDVYDAEDIRLAGGTFTMYRVSKR